MELADSVFKRQTYDPHKLLVYGFREVGGMLRHSVPIMNEQFSLEITIGEGRVKTDVIELATGELYSLYHVDAASGAFVGRVRSEAEKILQDIADNCFHTEIFKFEQTKELISYVQDRYADHLEFLWPRSPDNAIWRRKDNRKWYAVIITIPRRKLGLESDETVEIIDLRYPPEEMSSLIDNSRFFPGWHMNKKSWFSVILDKSVGTEEICRLIDKSYGLAVK